MPTAKNLFQILNVHPKRHISNFKNFFNGYRAKVKKIRSFKLLQISYSL